jgi:chromosome segregation ATPase
MNTVDQVRSSVDEIQKYTSRLARMVTDCQKYVDEAKQQARAEVSAELRKANEIKETHLDYREKEIARKTAELLEKEANIDKITTEMADKKISKQRQELELEHLKKMSELKRREKTLADNEASLEKLANEFYPKYTEMKESHELMTKQVKLFNSKIPHVREGLGIVVNKLDYIYKNVAPLTPFDFERETVKELADNLHKTFIDLHQR